MSTNRLEETVEALLAPGKGILAADETVGTISKRFESLGIASTEDSRRTYRELLFSTPGLSEFVSGVIMYDETIRQSNKGGVPLADAMAREGIIPGIKVDTGAKPLAGCPDEKVTEGLDGLRERLQEYRELGARFAKWRAVILIKDQLPSETCVEVNAQALGRYAALCQEQGLVPIVEPEVLMDGDHTAAQAGEVTSKVLDRVFRALYIQRVSLEGMLLKPNMVVSGKDCREQASVGEVATATLRCLRRHVPPAVPGIVFLSGGQDEWRATEHLNLMNDSPSARPRCLSFSYGRALQDPARGGKPSGIGLGQQALYHRARCNSAASLGKYGESMETDAEEIETRAQLADG